MIFEYIRGRNFLSLSEFDLPITPGLCLVKGVNYDMGVEGEESNGSGKSSLLDALLWVLYEVLNRPAGKVNSVINQAAGKNCMVETCFEHEGQAVVVRRFRKDDEEKGSGVRWWLDSKEQTHAKAKDTQKALESFLPVSVTVFKHAIQVGQGMPDRFLDLSESAKQDILCQMVDLTIYDDAQDETKQRLTEISNQEQLTQGTLQGLQEQIERFKLELGGYQSELIRYQALTGPQKAAQEQEVADLDNQLKVVGDRLQAVSVPPAEKITKLKAETERARTNVQKITQEGVRIKTELEGLVRDKDRIIASIEEAKKDKSCPTCGQSLPKGQLPADANDRILAIEDQIGEKRKEREALKQPYREQKTVFDAGQCLLERAQAEIRQAQAVSQRVQQEISQLTAKRDRVKDQLLSYERQIAHYRSKVEITEGSIAKMRESVVPQTEKLADLKNQRLHWEFWKNSIPNLRASAVEDVLGFLNERLDHYMDIFSSGTMGVRLYQEAYGKGSKLKVELRTAADTYGMSSGGEKKRVDLAIYLSLSDLLQASAGLKCNILAADEICDGLSPLGVQQFLSVLRQKADEGTSVFVVSHNPAVSQSFEFDSIKTVEKKSGRARLLAFS